MSHRIARNFPKGIRFVQYAYFDSRNPLAGRAENRRSGYVAKSSKTAKPSAPQVRPRRAWRRWLLVALIAAVAGGGWLDQQGGALIARHYLLREAAALGLQGEAIIGGTLRDGLAIESLRLSGHGALREVEIDRLRANWDLREIFSGQLRALDGERLRLVIDSGARSGKSSSSEEQAEEADETGGAKSTAARAVLMGKIRSVWKTHARDVDLEWRGIEVVLRDDDHEIASLDTSSIRHRRGEDTVHLQLGELRSINGLTLAPQNVSVALTEKGFTLDHLALPGGVGARDLEADASAFTLACVITHGESMARLRLNPGTIQLVLESGVIDIRGAVAPWVPWPESAAGIIESFGVQMHDWSQGPSGWHVVLETRLAGLTYDRWVVPTASVVADWKDQTIGVEAEGTAGHSPFKLTGSLLHDDIAFSGGSAEAEITSTAMGDVFATARDRFFPDARGLPVPDGAMRTRASGEWGKRSWKNLACTAITSAWKIGGKPLPDVEGTFAWAMPEARMLAALRPAPRQGGEWRADATWDMGALAYTGSLQTGGAINARPWLDFAGCFVRLTAVPLPVFALEWSGMGDVRSKEHAGEFNLAIPALGMGPVPEASAGARGRYDWPRSIDGVAIDLRSHDDTLTGHLAYDGKTIEVERLDWQRSGESAASASASIPWDFSIGNPRDFLKLEEPVRAEVKFGKHPLAFWETFLPPARRPPAMRGSLAGELSLAGSPARPEIKASVSADGLGFVSQPDFSDARLEMTARASGGKVELGARAEHADIEPILLNLSLPFEPGVWAENPEGVSTLPLSGSARMKDLRLGRYAPLLPALRELAGRVNVELALAGSVSSPELLGSIRLSGGSMAMKSPSIGRIERAELVVDFQNDRLSLSQGSARLGGGDLSITGDGQFKDGKSSFTFRAKGNHLLVWRDESMIVRANPDLALTGDGKDWKLSGSMPVVESIFARDVDFLPIGRSFTVPRVPVLPAFNPPPAPPSGTRMGSLALDVLVEMKDPLLIRGNVARGQVTGSARVTGDAAEPQVEGGFILTDGVARLPLSVLRVRRGEIVFEPGRGWIPELRASGRSKIPPYEVTVNVHGLANNVQVNLTSEPPLPPNEVLALLATGSTTGALEDPANAQAKAVQLLVQELRNGRLPFGRRLADLLGPLDEVQVQVGQESPFDGRARNGVAIEMTDRFLLTGAVDADGNQRLTLTILFRFR